MTSHHRTFTAKCTSLTQRYCNYCVRFLAFLSREVGTKMTLSESLLIDVYNNSFAPSRISSFCSRACEAELLFSCSTLRGRITVSLWSNSSSVSPLPTLLLHINKNGRRTVCAILREVTHARSRGRSCGLN